MTPLTAFFAGIAFAYLLLWGVIRLAGELSKRAQRKLQRICAHWEQPGPHCGRCGKNLDEAEAR